MKCQSIIGAPSSTRGFHHRLSGRASLMCQSQFDPERSSHGCRRLPTKLDPSVIRAIAESIEPEQLVSWQAGLQNLVISPSTTPPGPKTESRTDLRSGLVLPRVSLELGTRWAIVAFGRLSFILPLFHGLALPLSYQGGRIQYSQNGRGWRVTLKPRHLVKPAPKSVDLQCYLPSCSHPQRPPMKIP